MSTRTVTRKGATESPAKLLPVGSAGRPLIPEVVGTKSNPVPSGSSWAAIAVVAITAAVAAAIGALFIRPPFNWFDLGLVVVLVAVLEQRGGVPLPLGRSLVRFSGKAYASIGAVYLLGLSAAAASCIAYLLASIVLRQQAPRKMIFNSAMALIMYGCAYWVFEAVRQLTGTSHVEFAGALPDVFALILAGSLGGLAVWAVNHFLLGVVIAADQGLRNLRLRFYLHSITGYLPYYIGYGLTGLGAVAAARWLGPGAALITLAAPVAIVQTATNRWMREQQARVIEARSGFNATLISLSKAIDLRDSDTEGHCRRVVEYSLMMGRFLNFDDDELIRLCHGALLHDIGKIGVPDAILRKPGPLTDEEWEVMRTHPQLGALMVADVRQLERAREVILNHHERFDGKGYPRGLSGDDIPLAARVFTIADAFDAMISDRPYRKAMSVVEARAEVIRCSGTQFDPICVGAFASISDESLIAVGNKKEQPTEELLSL